jgi:hypothetical protein
MGREREYSLISGSALDNLSAYCSERPETTSHSTILGEALTISLHLWLNKAAANWSSTILRAKIGDHFLNVLLRKLDAQKNSETRGKNVNSQTLHADYFSFKFYPKRSLAFCTFIFTNSHFHILSFYKYD